MQQKFQDEEDYCFVCFETVFSFWLKLFLLVFIVGQLLKVIRHFIIAITKPCLQKISSATLQFSTHSHV